MTAGNGKLITEEAPETIQEVVEFSNQIQCNHLKSIVRALQVKICTAYFTIYLLASVTQLSLICEILLKRLHRFGP